VKKIFYLGLGIAFFLIGCSVKTTPVYVTLKTPKIKISDQGFLKEGKGYKEFELYKGGVGYKIVLKNSSVCLNSSCMNKEKFIKEYLGEDYPPCFLDCVIEGKPVKKFGKITKINGGFIQKNVNVYYSIQKNKVLFKDRRNGIVVLIKKLMEKQ